MDGSRPRGELKAQSTSAQDDILRTERQMVELSQLLRAVDEVPSRTDAGDVASVARRENQLAMVRLGIAGGLFAALRAKHADTAAHALRVTLGCSAWATALQLPPELHDAIEVGALLHDGEDRCARSRVD